MGNKKKVRKRGRKRPNYKRRRIICFFIALGVLLSIPIGIYNIIKSFIIEKPKISEISTSVATEKDYTYIDFLYKNSEEQYKYKLSSFENIREDYEKELNIQEVDYTWQGELEYNNKPRRLIIHHTSDTGKTPERMNEVHIENGWVGIGYHFYIRSDGTIYRGRPEAAIGAHAKKNNNDSIGIALEGDFNKTSPTEAQMESLVKLSVDMIIKYNLSEIEGHRDVYDTLCPGDNLSLDDLDKRIVNEFIQINKEIEENEKIEKNEKSKK